MMDRSCIRAVEDSVYAAGYPRDAAAVLLVELDGGSDAAVEPDAATVAEILRSPGARAVRTAADAAERERLWLGRKKAFGAMGRLSRDLVVQDAVVPRSALPDVLETIGGIAARYGLTVSNVFHAGDGNLHPNISFDGRVPGLKARVDAASGEIMTACIAAGGTITGEHGVGLDKLRYMPLIFDGAPPPSPYRGAGWTSPGGSGRRTPPPPARQGSAATYCASSSRTAAPGWRSIRRDSPAARSARWWRRRARARCVRGSARCGITCSALRS